MGVRLNSLVGFSILIAASTSLASIAMAEPIPPSPIQPIAPIQPINPQVPISPRTLGIQDPAGIPGSPNILTIEEAFERAFFDNDKPFFDNRSIPRQLDYLFGLRNSFPENEINRDAKNVHELYREVLRQQVASDPVLRTPDLPNPYNTSLFQLPVFNPTNRINPVQGLEFYEPLPPRF